MLKRRPVRHTEARRTRGTRLGALLLVLARGSALLGLLRLPRGLGVTLIPPDGGTLRSRCWRHFCGFGSTLVHFFLVFGSTLVTLLVWIHTRVVQFLVWIHTSEVGSTQVDFLVWIHTS